jgi:hypothetical protein
MQSGASARAAAVDTANIALFISSSFCNPLAALLPLNIHGTP